MIGSCRVQGVNAQLVVSDSELLQTEAVLFLGGVGLVEVGDVSDELKFKFGHGGGGHDACKGSDSEGFHGLFNNN